MDRPLGSAHPRHAFRYPVNYGELPSVEAADGEGLDAYLIGLDVPVERASGVVVAVIERLGDDDPKLVVSHDGAPLSDEEIERAVGFQERAFAHRLHRLTT